MAASQPKFANMVLLILVLPTLYIFIFKKPKSLQQFWFEMLDDEPTQWGPRPPYKNKIKFGIFLIFTSAILFWWYISQHTTTFHQFTLLLTVWSISRFFKIIIFPYLSLDFFGGYRGTCTNLSFVHVYRYMYINTSYSLCDMRFLGYNTER